MSARLGVRLWTYLCFAMALGACSRPDAIRGEPDAGREWVIEVPLDGGSPERGAWAAHAKAGEVVVIHAPPEQSWGAVIHAMDALKQFGGKRLLLAAGASRRSKTIVLPSTTELPIAPIAPKEGETLAPTALVVSVEIVADGSMRLNGENRRGIDEVRRALLAVDDGGLPTIVMLRADRDAPFGRVLDVVDVVQERGLRIVFGVNAQRAN